MISRMTRTWGICCRLLAQPEAAELCLHDLHAHLVPSSASRSRSAVRLYLACQLQHRHRTYTWSGSRARLPTVSSPRRTVNHACLTGVCTRHCPASMVHCTAHTQVWRCPIVACRAWWFGCICFASANGKVIEVMGPRVWRTVWLDDELAFATSGPLMSFARSSGVVCLEGIGIRTAPRAWSRWLTPLT